ncbi:MAG: hypothetical protein QXU98_12070 [Candidatus Parvarchaeota archaeon]
MIKMAIFDFKHLVYGVAGTFFGLLLGYLLGTALYVVTVSASIYNTTYLHSVAVNATTYPLLFSIGFAAAGFGFALLYSHEKDSATK